jgi:putative ATPase
MEPLATSIRPKSIREFIGQEHLLGENGPIKKLIEKREIPSMVFWGPPASGKTTLAEIIANEVDADFLRISAVLDGKDSLKKVLVKADANRANGKSTILFIDEIHRWSKLQQDALLPAVERGDIILVGATTENPSFTVISALLSRSRVMVFKQHSAPDIYRALLRGVDFIGADTEDSALHLLAEISNGDMRFALNSLQIAHSMVRDGSGAVTEEVVRHATQKHLRYDKDGEEHYNLISAVHKSLRSSNPSAATYWVVRMLAAGEDPLYIARRLLRFASEDIGNAHPTAVVMANAVFDTCHKLGMPECEVALVQLCEYLANCKKSNRAYTAQKKARADIERYGNLEVPMHLRNAPTSLMKELGYGEWYEYDHDLDSKKSNQQCMPDQLGNREYF